jgi:hypothetical protein
LPKEERDKLQAKALESLRGGGRATMDVLSVPRGQGQELDGQEREERGHVLSVPRGQGQEPDEQEREERGHVLSVLRGGGKAADELERERSELAKLVSGGKSLHVSGDKKKAGGGGAEGRYKEEKSGGGAQEEGSLIQKMKEVSMKEVQERRGENEGEEAGQNEEGDNNEEEEEDEDEEEKAERELQEEFLLDEWVPETEDEAKSMLETLKASSREQRIERIRQAAIELGDDGDMSPEQLEDALKHMDVFLDKMGVAVPPDIIVREP